uniref:Uncharacterized protein n=1 Tax=Podarcis muralis TaxID=64176 RepID=A0A670K7S3_PODMU
LFVCERGWEVKWQMSIGISEDNLLFSCSIWRPQGKSYLFFTQFKGEVKGAKIEYGMAYVKKIKRENKIQKTRKNRITIKNKSVFPYLVFRSLVSRTSSHLPFLHPRSVN